MDRNVVIITLLTLVAILLYGQIDHLRAPWSEMDLKYYRMMADASPSIAPGIPRPFSYRVLGPWLAGLAGGGSTRGFLLLTILSSLALTVLTYRVFLVLGASRTASLIAVTLLIFNKHLFGTGNWNFFQVKDTMSLAIMAGALLAMYRGRNVIFGALLATGALVSELPLLMIPVFAVYLAERGELSRGGDVPAALGKLALCLPAAAVFLSLRVFLPAGGGLGLLGSAVHYGAKMRYPMVWFGLLINPFIPMTFVPLVLPARTAAFVRGHAHLAAFFILVLVSAAFGSNNERLMAPAAIPFYALTAFLLDSRPGRSSVVRTVVLAGAAVASLHHTIARFPLPDRSLTAALSLGALAAVTAAFFIGRQRSQEGTGLRRRSLP